MKLHVKIEQDESGYFVIVIRGIERCSIFKDNKDRDNLLERLSNLSARNQAIVLKLFTCLWMQPV